MQQDFFIKYIEKTENFNKAKYIKYNKTVYNKVEVIKVKRKKKENSITKIRSNCLFIYEIVFCDNYIEVINFNRSLFQLSILIITFKFTLKLI